MNAPPTVDTGTTTDHATRQRTVFHDVSGFFVLRTPLLAMDLFQQWSEGFAEMGRGDCVSSDEFVEQRRVLADRLVQVCKQPVVGEALQLSSSDLAAAFSKWTSSPRDRLEPRLERSLVRYFTRMTTRPTPLGMLAGWTVGTVGNLTELRLDPLSTYKRKTSLDPEFISDVAARLAENPGFADKIVYYSNETLYESVGQIRYCTNGQRQDGRQLAATQLTPHLSHLLSRAKAGATVPALIDSVVSAFPQVPLDDAVTFIWKAIQSGLLIADILPPITSADPLRTFLDSCESRGIDCSVTQRLSQFRHRCSELDASGITKRQDYTALLNSLPGLDTIGDLGHLFRVDLMKPGAATLGPEVVAQARLAVELLCRVGVPDIGHVELLESFKSEFRERYGNRFVRVVDVFDSDTGLEWSLDRRSALLDGLTVARESFRQPPHTKDIWKKLKQQIYCAGDQGQPEFHVSASELLDWPSAANRLPDSFHVAFALEETGSRPKYRVVFLGISGPPGTRTFGRYCQSDPALHALVTADCAREQRGKPDALLAEVVYEPLRTRRGIVQRPAFRAFEIPYLGRPGVTGTNQIPVTDLLVSVVGDDIVVYSQSRSRQVIPRVTNALAYNALGTPRLYRFLCCIAQPPLPVRPFWEIDDRRPTYLPRVVAAGVVLSRASWRINTEHFQDAIAMKGDHAYRAVQSLRIRFRWPRYIGVVDGENTCIVDLDNPLSTASLLSLIKGVTDEHVRMIEVCPSPDRNAVVGAEGRFAHEIILPMIQTVSGEEQDPTLERRRRSIAHAQSLGETRRRFDAGSDWTYIKLYTTVDASDHVLKHVIEPFVRACSERRLLTRWFFIRYRDPQPHLRLRLYSTIPGQLAAQLDQLQQVLRKTPMAQAVHRVQCDSYEREIERYGGIEGITLAEELFEADSAWALRVISLSTSRDTDSRWTITAKSVDQLLSDVGLDVHERHRFWQSHTAALFAQLGLPRETAGSAAHKYRAHKPELAESLAPDAIIPPVLGAALGQRSQRIRAIARRIDTCRSQGEIYASNEELSHSFVHMAINRLMPSDQNEYEYVISDFLKRHYTSELARATHTNANGQSAISIHRD